MSTISTAARNAACDATTALVDGGAGAGTMVVLAGATVLATITLADPAYGASAAGVATGAGFPRSDTSADATGTADGFEIRDSDANVVISGSAGTSGTDLVLDSVSVTSGQNVTINSLTHTQPAS